MKTCRDCRGTGSRIHGWAMCPGPCQTCDGSGVQQFAATPLTDTQVAEALTRVRAYLASLDEHYSHLIVVDEFMIAGEWFSLELADLRTLLALADEADARKDAI